MKRMLTTELIEYAKSLSDNLGSNCDGINLKNIIMNDVADPILGIDGTICLNYRSEGLILSNGNAIIDPNGRLFPISLDEMVSQCGAIFNPIDATLFEKKTNIHAYSLGTIARGFFKIAAGKSVTAGTDIYQTTGQALHDAILAGNEDDMPYTHILCKVKGGAWFWLSMTANGADKVFLSPNINLNAGDECYVVAAVQSAYIDS